MSRGLVAGACAAILSIAGAAHAQEASEPLAVAYEAPEGCPTAAAFFREVSARTTRARAAQPNERARIMHVVVTRRDDQHAGRLWIEDANASSTSRFVSGRTCSEVVGALALIGALAVDPRASTAPIVTAPAVTEAPPAAAAGTTSEPAAPAEAARPAEKTAPPTAPPAPERAAVGPASPAAYSRSRLAIGAQAEIAVVAGAVASGRVFADLSIGPREGLFAPALRLAAARSLEVDRAAAVGGASLRWTAGALDVCPLRFALAGPLAVRPCVGGSFGVLEASGTGIATSVSRSRPWATVSALARLVWEPARWLDVELEAGGIAPLYRESFFFGPNVPVYEAPAVAFLSRAGLGVRFP